MMMMMIIIIIIIIICFFSLPVSEPGFFFITMRLEWTQILTEHAKSFLQFSQFFTRFLHQAKKKNYEYVTKFETISTQ